MLVPAVDQFDVAGVGGGADPGRGVGGDDANLRARVEEGSHFALGDPTAADDHRQAALEQKDRRIPGRHGRVDLAALPVSRLPRRTPSSADLRCS